MNLSADAVFTNIWAKDKLDRRGYADFLYKVIESAKTSEAEDNALIFAIDGEWGTGKSFFIDCWIDDLRAKGHLVSRFDAWKNDIVDEPLIGFLSHIYKDVGDWDNKRLTKVAGEKIKQSQKSILPLAKELVKGAAIKGLGYLVTDEVAREVSKTIAESSDKVTADQEKDEQSMSAMLMHRQLQAHNKNLQLIEEFKNKLSSVAQNLVSASDRRQPVFIFIDELDRCRPDYAVRLLEVVKHIFNSKGICFISSVNIKQLQQSIKTIYGEAFEADRYLDRFFSHRLKLPLPSTKDYISSLPEFRTVKDTKLRWVSQSDSVGSDFDETAVNFYEYVCVQLGFDLRTIKSVFSRLIMCRSFFVKDNDKFFHDEFLFLILCLFKANRVSDRISFEALLDNNSINVTGQNFFYFTNYNGVFKFRVATWKNVIIAIKHIYRKIYDRSYPPPSDEDSFDVLKSIENDLVGFTSNYQKSVNRLNRYMEICAMSGRLDE